MGWSWPVHQQGRGRGPKSCTASSAETIWSYGDTDCPKAKNFILLILFSKRREKKNSVMPTSEDSFFFFSVFQSICLDLKSLSSCLLLLQNFQRNWTETLGNLNNFPLILNCQENRQSIFWFWNFPVMLGYDEPQISISTIYDYEVELPHRRALWKADLLLSPRTLSS